MILDFSKDLSRVDIYAHGYELSWYLGCDCDENGNRLNHLDSKEVYVATIRNPKLVSENAKIYLLGEDKSGDSTLRETIWALYTSPIKKTRYNNVEIKFEQAKYPTVWGPSIDTLLFAKALEKVYLKGSKTAAEIGTGSGYLSKYLLHHSPQLESLAVIDINSDATLCAKDCINDPRAIFHTGDGMKFLNGKGFDLVMCNPPYIPRPLAVEDNPYEGVGLLRDLILEARNYLNPSGKMVTNISSLSNHIIDKAIDESGVKVKLLEEMEVPLKVFNVLNNKKWRDYLIENKGLKKERKEGYDYWHTIQIVEIQP